MEQKSKSFADYKINVRLKLALLWTSTMFCYIYGDYFELYVPKKVESLLNGHNLLDSPSKLLAATIMLTVPAIVIAITITVRPRVTRLINIITATFFTLLTLLIGITTMKHWLEFYSLLAFVETALTAVILWTAWTWPKE
jgi:uncharacterized membrane protein